jgi:hypothetical protein
MRRVPPASRVPLKLVAFLTAVPVQSNLTASNQESHKNRVLEHDVWKKYVPNGIPKGMMVYHWKKEVGHESRFEDFSAFVKIETRHSGWRILVLYLLIAFIFGVLGNLAASAIWDWKTSFSSAEPPTRSVVPNGSGKTKANAP